MARSSGALPDVVAEPAQRPRKVQARGGRRPPAPLHEPEPRQGPILLAQARRHWLALVPPILGGVALAGAGCALMSATPALHTPLALALTSLTLLCGIGLIVLPALCAWHVFRIDVYNDRIIVHELRGLLARAEQHPMGYTAVLCDRWPPDWLLGTGTIILHGAAGRRCFRLVTPVGWVRWITTPGRSR